MSTSTIGTKIEWTWTPRGDGTFARGFTWNPWRGCDKVSPGCDNCYAETLSGQNHGTLGQWGSVAEGGIRTVGVESYWQNPARWVKHAAREGVRCKVFCLSLGDWLEDWPGPMLDHRGSQLWLQQADSPFGPYAPVAVSVPERYRPLTMAHARLRLLWTVYNTADSLDWLLLTKRPENWHAAVCRVLNLIPPAGFDRFKVWLSRWLGGDAPRGVWFGYSAENQPTLKYRALHAEKVPTVCRWVSYEPSLGPLDISAYSGRIDWLIAGGESGSGSREFDVEWARDVRDQCRAYGVAFYLKQLGENPVNGLPETRDLTTVSPWPKGTRFEAPSARIVLPVLRGTRGQPVANKGADPAEWPADLRVREYPVPRESSNR